jgi:endonuclease III
MVKVTVLGGGSWGTAISLMLLNNGHKVKIWDRSKEVLSLIDEGENLRYLPGVRIPHSIITEPDINRSLEHADIAVIAIPVQYIRAVLNSIDKSKLKRKTIFVNLSKGMEISSLKLPQYIFKEIIGDFNYCTLSGPSHAEEVSRGVPTSVVVASKKRRMNEYIQKIFSSKTFRVYSNEDLIGVEISGAVKNIYAIGAGVIDGFGKWDNTKAALITRAIVEINRYGRHYELSKARPEDLYDLIKPSGMYKQKSKRIVEISKIIVKDYDGKVPDNLEELLKLPGVGRKTANIVLYVGFSKNALAVDTHVHRISNRLGWVKTKKPEQTEDELKKIIPPELWGPLNGAMVNFGQKICKPISPNCPECFLNDVCPSAYQFLKTNKK